MSFPFHKTLFGNFTENINNFWAKFTNIWIKTVSTGKSKSCLPLQKKRNAIIKQN